MIPTPQQLMIGVLAAGALAAGAYFYGRSDGRELEKAAWVERDNDSLREANQAIGALHAKIRKQENDHAVAQAQLLLDHEKDLEDVETERDRALAAMRSGKLRLRNATAPRCPADGGGAPETPAATAASDAPAARSELPEARDGTAFREEAVVALLSEADAVVTELNLCWGVVRKDRGL